MNKSLYGLREAPKLWVDWLGKGLDSAGFKPSKDDPGVFYGRGMAIAVYVDDVLFFGPDESEMKKVIADLQADGYELKLEKEGSNDTYDFLGINLVETNGILKLTQHGLIKKFLQSIGCSDCNAVETPAATSPLGTDAKGEVFREEWEYASAVGMIMYLAGNAHPKIQFSVHQCTQFTHTPRKSHQAAIKRIGSYLQGIL